jgi:hypothetical protein
MNSITITRSQYNQLIDTQHAWMQRNWLSFKREWQFGGVKVSGASSKQMEQLFEMVNNVSPLSI